MRNQSRRQQWTQRAFAGAVLVALAGLLAPAAAHAQTLSAETQATGPAGRSVERSVQVQRGPGGAARSASATRQGPAASRQLQTYRGPDGAGRSVTATGPGGNTYHRELSVERGPDGVSRSVRIDRPGGSYERQVAVARGPGYAERDVSIQRPGGASFERRASYDAFGAGFGPPPPPMVRNVVVERDYYIEPPPVAVGFGAPMFSFFLGSPPPPPLVVVEPLPPPVVVVEPQVPPTVVVREPQRYRQQPETVVVDPVVNAIGRLSSRHNNSRRDGALTLGKLGDARAVTPLLDRLRNDGDPDVREASAWALGAIGDPRAAAMLQYTSIHDRKSRVRSAATAALGRLETAPRVIETAPVVESRTQILDDPNALTPVPEGAIAVDPPTPARAATPASALGTRARPPLTSVPAPGRAPTLTSRRAPVPNPASTTILKPAPGGLTPPPPPPPPQPDLPDDLLPPALPALEGPTKPGL